MAFWEAALSTQDVYYIKLPTIFRHTSKIFLIIVQMNSSVYKSLVNLYRTD